MPRDDPMLMAEWERAFDHRNEAERRYIRARRGDGTMGPLELAKRDFDAAQAAYEEVASRISTNA